MRIFYSIIAFVILVGCANYPPFVTTKTYRNNMAKMSSEVGTRELAINDLEELLCNKQAEIDNINSTLGRIRSVNRNNERDLSDLLAKYNNLMMEYQDIATKLQKARKQKEESDKLVNQFKNKLDGEILIKTLKNKVMLSIANKILFDTNEAVLKSSSLESLDRIISVLANYKNNNISVEGNTDNVPVLKTNKHWQDNWELSTERALVVLRYLISKGNIEPTRIKAVGFSKYNPVSTNKTESGRSLNRRVDIVITPNIEN